jgi:hypothetical protein
MMSMKSSRDETRREAVKDKCRRGERSERERLKIPGQERERTWGRDITERDL